MGAEEVEDNSAKIAELKKKVKEARKEDKKLKKALKAAKAELAAAEANGAEKMDEEGGDDEKQGTKRSRDEEETKEGGEVEDEWAKLSAKKQKTAPAANADVEGEPNEKCFIGNLSWDIDDDACREFFKDCGTIVDIFWVSDRDTGKFKGFGFVTFASKEESAKAVAKAGMELMGRPLKINYAKPRPGGDRKPRKSFGGGGTREMSEKPPGCTTVFCGNLSFDIDDDKMRQFASNAGNITNIRWLTDRESGQFKGCGFIDFESTEGVDEFVKKNGNDLMGRPIRIDYAKSRS